MKAFRTILIILAIVPIATGLLDRLLGAKAINLLGPALSVDSLSNPTLNSQIRFFGVIWFGFGAALLLVASNVVQHITLFRLVAVFIFLSGFGRLASLIQFGMPAPPLLGATIVELVLVPMLYLWHVRLVRNA